MASCVEVYAGPHWVDGEVREGWIAAEAGRIVDEGGGQSPRAAVGAVLLDTVHNYHTHVGDAFLLGSDLPRSLEELVAPGSGLKHRRLSAAKPETIQDGIRRHLESARRAGVSSLLDFREQGEDGIRLARGAQTKDGPRLLLLGRPAQTPAKAEEVDSLVAAADGVGAPGVKDWGLDACAALSEAAHRRGKPFALHASEGEAENLEDILGLDPDLLVHLGAATRADLRLVADAGTPVAVCPSSNEFFHVPCAADRLVAMGIPWYLGTDNAMLGHADPVDEARRLHGRHPDLEDDELFRALTTPPEKAINALDRDSEAPAARRRVRVLPLNASDHVRWDAPPIVLERIP